MAIHLSHRSAAYRFFRDICIVVDLIERCSLSIPDIYLEALVSAEDRRFWFHPGVDFFAIIRAAYRGVFFKRREGASTIEAQLFRVVTGRRELSFPRKAREIFAALVISLVCEKRSIAFAYLDNAFFGYERRGIRYAAEKYACSLDEGKIDEVALLISLIRRPMSANYHGPRRDLLVKRIKWLSARIS